MQQTKQRRESDHVDPEIAEVKARSRAEVEVEEIDAMLDGIDKVLEESGGLKEAEERAAYREKLLGWASHQRRLSPSWSEQDELARQVLQSILPCQC